MMDPALGRRSFLGLAAGAALVPPFVETGFHSSSKTSLEKALALAKDRAKPLLVLIVPVDADARTARGDIWGELIANADTATLAALSLVEVTCATAADLALLGQESPGEASMAVLLETGKDNRSAMVSSEGLSMRTLHTRGKGPWDYEKGGMARVTDLGKRLRDVILAGEDRLDELWDQWKARYDVDYANWFLHDVDDSVDRPRPRLRHVDLAAAPIYHYAETSAHAMKAWGKHLASAASLRLFEDDLDGARWSTRANHCPPCGMGFTPDVARHFLEFYTEDESK